MGRRLATLLILAVWSLRPSDGAAQALPSGAGDRVRRTAGGRRRGLGIVRKQRRQTPISTTPTTSTTRCACSAPRWLRHGRPTPASRSSAKCGRRTSDMVRRTPPTSGSARGATSTSTFRPVRFLHRSAPSAAAGIEGTDNPLIGYPLAYQYLTSLRPDAAPATVGDLVVMRARGWRPRTRSAPRSPARACRSISAFRWDTGVQAHWQDRRST